MKITTNGFLVLAFMGLALTAQAQETDEALASKDTTASANRVKLDGIAAVIGDYVILESDIDKTLIDLQNQGASTEDVTRCGLLGKLMEDRLYAHQAVQDSLLVSDDQVNAQSDAQIQQLSQQIGSVEKMLRYYKKPDMESFREELFEINKLRMLSEQMQSKIVKEIEVTPEEVRQFFYRIPEDERPVFGAELEIAQIVKQPEAPEEEKQKVINTLKEIRQDVVENDGNFRVKAILHSQDPASRPNGGFYSITKETGFVKEFKDVAFSLREGEVSEPFETIFGYHIIFVEKIRGQERDIRHILMIPEIPQSAIDKAMAELDSIRQQVLDGKYTFADAALNFSDEKETKFDGGLLRNPVNFDSRFELTKMDPSLYNQVRNLKDEEISRPIREDDPRGGAPKLKIMKISNRYDEHKADFAKDYLKIQELALREKQFKAIKEWMNEHIEDTYIHVNEYNRSCDFANNWVKE
ncbi:peptidylprolyl isomerase [Flagellimonas zhangzhouensis]|uniref:Periplasmic chaperone for outer membrane proteins SurA n=1 Tax=Flagellimonas zhangzhouensis TaxID=1073328 RepID=A0A1H2Z9W5_9FLAO|nr:peptidylprolyl isomerase [Allomuricauda zhangzhouensis]SDR07814.1 periplasmic chaperone for outer membrane proteins SurA [Allomuricauda zhangzhouensis]SDX13589.1 periplasmic chaperone for outer membrane proteins SurA [Allomuricauda zhangzhouensis]